MSTQDQWVLELTAKYNRDRTVDILAGEHVLAGGRRLKPAVAMALLQRFAQAKGTVLLTTHTQRGEVTMTLVRSDGTTIPYIETGTRFNQASVPIATDLLYSMDAILRGEAPAPAPEPVLPPPPPPVLEPMEEFDVEALTMEVRAANAAKKRRKFR